MSESICYLNLFNELLLPKVPCYCHITGKLLSYQTKIEGRIRFGKIRFRIEWFVLEGTLEGHLVQPPCRQARTSLTRIGIIVVTIVLL